MGGHLLPTARPAPRWRATLAAGTGIGMLSGSLLAVPHSILMLVIGVLSRLTGAEGPCRRHRLRSEHSTAAAPPA